MGQIFNKEQFIGQKEKGFPGHNRPVCLFEKKERRKERKSRNMKDEESN